MENKNPITEGELSIYPRIKPGDVVRHFKRETIDTEKNPMGYLYLFHGVGEHTETGEKFAVYSALYNDPAKNVTNGKIYIRPYEMFMSEVDKEKYPDIKQKYRLEIYIPGKYARRMMNMLYGLSTSGLVDEDIDSGFDGDGCDEYGK